MPELSGVPHIYKMKVIIESSMYLIIMALICLFSVDFVSMNMGITQVGQLEQYVEDYIELNGVCQADNSLDAITVQAINQELEGKDVVFSYEYMTRTDDYAYYKVHIKYSLRSAVFNNGKTHTFDGIARVDI
ncbi:MAG: hypothetical protein IJB96_03455 [Lachnospira sp.]|nr:hypothetical protein [Lachnospira sp.]